MTTFTSLAALEKSLLENQELKDAILKYVEDGNKIKEMREQGEKMVKEA